MFEFLANGGIPALIVILGYSGWKLIQHAYSRSLAKRGSLEFQELEYLYKKGEMDIHEYDKAVEEKCEPLWNRAQAASERWDFWNA